MGIIIGLVIALVVIVVVVNAIQQHKEKQEKERRAKAAKQKAVIDETEELILNLTHLPSNPKIVEIMNRRSLNACKAMSKIMPEVKGIKNRIQEMESRLSASEELSNNAGADEVFVLPDNEQQLVVILQTIKKLRLMLKAEQTKGVLDAPTYMHEDQKLDVLQLRISVESLFKRGMQAYNKEMLGSARQYFEKALQTLTEHPLQTDYSHQKREEIEAQLEEITLALKSSNAKDAEKKAKAEEDDLDMLFQPKKKW
ncbi:hypothetical protein [Thalassotalea sp. G2M2-11]|uniref:hypothetical protein n=1 Tax=Thalassotalea sp. G2M2-11 TaxID=2787627 RepID=UPI0019D2127F|nr:hypothetical protein [Thalassotalea sp. G2M2-11]